MSAVEAGGPRARVGYVRPRTLSEAVSLLDEHGSEARLLAGGTDLAVALRQRKASPRVVVDLKGIGELSPAIGERDERFVINANTPMTEVEGDDRLRNRIPGLIEAAEVVGSVQVRNRATLAGNLCNASPAADTPPMLMALEATVAVTGPDGDRRLPVDEFLTGYRQTALHRGELVRAVEIPVPAPRSGTAFLKLGVRRSMEISIVCVGVRLDLGDDGTVVGAGIGLGSVAPTTVRASRSEEGLLGRQPSAELFAEAGAIASEACSPIDDLRASAEYRVAMVPVLVERALGLALERTGERG